MSSGMKERLCRSLEKVLHAETREELPAAVGGILLFFLLFLAYSMLCWSGKRWALPEAFRVCSGFLRLLSPLP